MLEVLRFVCRAEEVGVGRVGLLGGHLVGEAGADEERGHLRAAAELVDEGLVEPRLVDLEVGVGEQPVAVEALDVVALEGGAVAPDVDVVFLHRRDEHRAGDARPMRRGVEVRDARGGDVERAGLRVRRCLRAPAAARQSMRRALAAPYSSAFPGIAS